MTCCYRYNDHLSIGRYRPSQSVRWWGLPLIGQMAHTLASDWSPPAPGVSPDIRWWEYCRSCHVNWADNLKIRTLLPDNFWWPPIFLCLRLTEDREERRWLTWVHSYPRFLWLWETIWVLSNCRVPIMTSNEFWVPISKVVKLMNCLLENVNVGTRTSGVLATFDFPLAANYSDARDAFWAPTGAQGVTLSLSF